MEALPGSVQVLPTMLLSVMLSLVITMALEGIMSIGLCHYFTNLTAGRPLSFADLFSGFRILVKAACTGLVMAGFVFLWTLVGVVPVTVLAVWWTMGRTVTVVEQILVIVLILLSAIPGIIAAYRYAMTPYIVAEFTDIPVMDAIRESKRLMKKNVGRFFCLQISFLGWTLLSLLTLGIGSLWLAPYKQAANAAFYMDVTGRSDLQEEP